MIPSKHAIVPWIVEYAALLLNRFEAGRDGKTSYERSKGKKSKLLGIEFGVSVLWRRKAIAGARGKQIIVGNLEGVWKTRTVQIKP